MNTTKSELLTIVDKQRVVGSIQHKWHGGSYELSLKLRTPPPQLKHGYEHYQHRKNYIENFHQQILHKLQGADYVIVKIGSTGTGNLKMRRNQ